MEKGVLATRVWKYGPHKNAGVRMRVYACVFVSHNRIIKVNLGKGP